MSDTVLIERAGDIATVVLNRPQKLNAFTKEMWGRMGEAFRDLSADDGVRCIVVRGAGDRAFSPGNDISEFSNERANAKQAEA
jgi:enoyl-CoA hydratase/carnithine racemase